MAYDNAAYWGNVEGFHTGKLNHPEQYAGETSPSPLPETQKVIAKHRVFLATHGQSQVEGDVKSATRSALEDARRKLKEVLATVNVLLVAETPETVEQTDDHHDAQEN